MTKTFRRPFSVVEPLDPKHFRKGGLNSPDKTTTLWTVEDADSKVISSHATEAGAKAAIAIAEAELK